MSIEIASEQVVTGGKVWQAGQNNQGYTAYINAAMSKKSQAEFDALFLRYLDITRPLIQAPKLPQSTPKQQADHSELIKNLSKKYAPVLAKYPNLPQHLLD